MYLFWMLIDVVSDSFLSLHDRFIINPSAEVWITKTELSSKKFNIHAIRTRKSWNNILLCSFFYDIVNYKCLNDLSPKIWSERFIKFNL